MIDFELLHAAIAAAGIGLIAAIRFAGRWLDDHVDAILGDDFYGDDE